MKEYGKEVKRSIAFIGGLFILFLCIRYWTMLENMAKLAVGAAAPLITGCVVAFVMNILMMFYEGWYEKILKVKKEDKIKRIVCLILAFVTLGVIIYLIINQVLPELINCIASFINMVPAVVEWIVDIVGEEDIIQLFPFLKGDIDMSTIGTQVEQLIKTVLNGFGGAVNSIMAVLTSMVSMVINLVIGLMFSVYVLIDKEKLAVRAKRLIKTYLPKPAEKIFYTIQVLHDSFHKFVVGQVLEAVIIGVLCIIGMMLFGFPYPVMIGVFTGFTALIPIAGAWLGAGVGAVLMLATDPILAIEFLIFIVILQQLEGNFIYPRVVGSSIGLPSIWVLVAITIGGGVLGVGGMLLAVPLFAAGYRLIREDMERRDALAAEAAKQKLAQSEASEDTETKREADKTSTESDLMGE